jgi:hypothetical protein
MHLKGELGWWSRDRDHQNLGRVASKTAASPSPETAALERQPKTSCPGEIRDHDEENKESPQVPREYLVSLGVSSYSRHSLV